MNIESFKRDKRVVQFGACLASSSKALVSAGKILIQLRQEIKDCDEALIKLYPELNASVLQRLADCGSGRIIPEFVYMFGTIANKLIALSPKLQRKVYAKGVKVVTGGTADKPLVTVIQCNKLLPGHAAQAFDGSQIRSIAQQVKYRVAKARANGGPSYKVTDAGVQPLRLELITWDVIEAIIATRKPVSAPLTGASRAAAPVPAA